MNQRSTAETLRHDMAMGELIRAAESLTARQVRGLAHAAQEIIESEEDDAPPPLSFRMVRHDSDPDRPA